MNYKRCELHIKYTTVAVLFERRPQHI